MIGLAALLASSWIVSLAVDAVTTPASGVWEILAPAAASGPFAALACWVIWTQQKRVDGQDRFIRAIVRRAYKMQESEEGEEKL